ncbi:FOG: Transposon-encoded proteins with TYA, reverse transcriptase, integrase domains in various combinations [Plasmopara halstedii]|uniref:FOG: Transposon-encoded proteins with TYA, reverse transcriptase, integrase domains in various combinations n=1 Tax=Plasmopara halstedii TaxID=4781 RepID=A0A0P1ASP9_PLAHL|nr:FOG: Transposon-encoded proteins with TYA, reverse transcriptase, integrase domains in various combinations [Plasmopara halstedii]CEG45064.1 FOG: Transposon-encoded proteins with TYA, reverse transcriptase, integrase domains in various combinations [Plasmopara halstedii]|eukprot:XP_024581433.1 FOG: Transposon-encoded proteins with TYA, reverse transcriptase, integrase domains in various combinations [Plasmopara halstedii]
MLPSSDNVRSEGRASDKGGDDNEPHNDLLVGEKTEKQLQTEHNALDLHFMVKWLGDVKFMLGMEVKHDRTEGKLVIRQTQFNLGLLEQFGQDANSVRNPKIRRQYSDNTHAHLDSKTKNRELIGSMLHIVNATHPDISIALSILSQYLDDPREMDCRAAIRVLRHLEAIGI